jgi:hypothetical protein
MKHHLTPERTTPLSTRKLLVALAAVVTSLSALSSIMAVPVSAQPAPHIVDVVGTNNGLSNNGGYVLLSNGAVNVVAGAPFYGDARHKGLNNFVALAQDGTDGGYWLVTTTGQSYPYGNVGCTNGEVWTGPALSRIQGAVVGTIDAPGFDSGYVVVTATGHTYEFSCQFSF